MKAGPTVKITEADLRNPDHRAAIVRLNRDFAVISDVSLPDDHAEGLDSLLATHPTVFAYLAWDDADEAIGYALCQFAISSFLPGMIVNLHDIYIAEQGRSRGLGRAMIARLEERAREQGCGKITLEVTNTNVKAQKLYRELGFSDGHPDGDGDSTWFWYRMLD
jgi:ribosomal protein S18 acetylase RimI-like enzyme